ncbi:MAG TPA: nucleotide sugar dehydrogenase [Candidatus Latescibacteria bacterium]|nr:nucleotide sugar dehydrogenase [Candidatus Latescibacterota bacterium]
MKPRIFREKGAKVGVIGLGYVGLPLVLRFCEEGFRVLGFDVDPTKVERLNRGESYIGHIPDERLRKFKARSQATTDMDRLGEADAILICVPTPLTERREPDLKYVRKTAEEVSQRLRSGQLVCLESTTYPGTTREVLLPILEGTGLKVGRDFHLVYSPEREDPGNPRFTTKTIPKLVGGVTPRCLEAGVALYSAVVEKVVPVSSPEVAEAAKLLENIYRAVNIALVNELKMLFDRMGIDIWEVIEAAKTKPFGFQAFYPGPGLGGHCIPIDPFYLSWKAKEYDCPTKFIELAGEVNTYMPYYVVQKTIDALNDRGKSIRGARVLILGVAYKRDVDDMRGSPALKIIKLLSDRGALVEYHDPYIPQMPPTRKYRFDMRSISLDEAKLREYDVVIVVTDHTIYDYDRILRSASLVVDTRGAIRRASDKVVRA